MIRVNLLPQKREARREAGQGWLLAVGGVAVAEIIGLLLFHNLKIQELEDQKKKNQELSSEIDSIKKTVANHTEIKAKLEALRAREEAITKLQTARTGPTAVLLEVAKMLTKGKEPTVDPDFLLKTTKDNPAAVYNKGWDAHRLWLTRYEEAERVVHVKGVARDAEDVAEFSKRLSLSNYFSDVRLLGGTQVRDATTQLELIGFELQAKARY